MDIRVFQLVEITSLNGCTFVWRVVRVWTLVNGNYNTDWTVEIYTMWIFLMPPAFYSLHVRFYWDSVQHIISFFILCVFVCKYLSSSTDNSQLLHCEFANTCVNWFQRGRWEVSLLDLRFYSGFNCLQTNIMYHIQQGWMWFTLYLI